MAAEDDDGQGPAPRLLKRSHGFAVGAIGLAAAAFGLLYTVAPGLRPDPRERVGADVSVFALEPKVTIADWIERGFPEERHAALRRAHPDDSAVGELLYVRTAVDGHKHRGVRVRYAVYDARRQTRLPASAIDGPPPEAIKLDAPSERSVQLFWVPDLTSEPGPLVIRVEMVDDKGILAVADSPPIVRGRLQPQ